MRLDVGDVVLCTVDRIVGTAVFVKIHSIGKELEGSIILSEIAPGRIRNLRDYVVPKKKIVCKILRISGDRIELSLRRVTQKERKEVMEQFKQEKSYQSILKSVLGEEAVKIINKIYEKESIYDLLQEAKEDPKKIEIIFGKNNSEKILDILKSQKQKKAIVKKEINLKTISPNGLELIKGILGKVMDGEVNYISAGRYLIKSEAGDIKSADSKFRKITEELEKNAKKEGMEFSIKEK